MEKLIMGMTAGSTIVLCLAIALVLVMMVAAVMGPKLVRKRRELRRRGLS